MHIKLTFIVVVVLLGFLSNAIAHDSVFLNYQGRLTDNGGNPLTGVYNLTFTIYDESGGSPVSNWSEQYTVEVSDGLFSQELGPIPETSFTSDQMYLGIQVELNRKSHRGRYLRQLLTRSKPWESTVILRPGRDRW